MPHITGKLNLTKLQHVVSKTKKGNDVIIIPVDANHLYKSDKGNIFLDIFMWENEENSKAKEFGDFSIKQSLPKDVQEKMKADNEGKDKADKVYAPSLGNANYVGVRSNEVEVNEEPNFDIADDLPF